MKAKVGELGFGGIAEDLFFVDSVAGVSAELVVPDSGAAPF